MLAFFDMSHVNIKRYNSSMRKYFSSAIAMVDDGVFFENDPDFSECVKTSWWSIGRMQRYFVKKGVTCLVISGQRIPDYRVILAAKAANVKVIYKMHGLYVPHMKRSLGFFLGSFEKVFRFLFYLVQIGLNLRSARIPIFMFLNFTIGSPRRLFVSRTKKLDVDVAGVWSEYWKDWHINNYSFNLESNFVYIGNPDYEKFKFSAGPADTYLYIYQTLVEDGRITQTEMDEYYKSLANAAAAKGKRIYVKMHPRAGQGAGQHLERLGFGITEELWSDSVFIGHYSSLLGLAPGLNSKVIIHELSGHPTPESIVAVANKVVTIRPGASYLPDVSRLAAKATAANFYFGSYPDTRSFEKWINFYLNV